MTHNASTDWTTGDWCFFEFNLCQITVKDGRVHQASDGSFSTSGHDLSYACRPLTLRNSAITDNAEYWSARLHKEGHAGLNYPDIHRKLVELWVLACDSTEGDEAAVAAIGKFAKAVLDASKKPVEIDGVPLLRNRLA